MAGRAVQLQYALPCRTGSSDYGINRQQEGSQICHGGGVVITPFGNWGWQRIIRHDFHRPRHLPPGELSWTGTLRDCTPLRDSGASPESASYLGKCRRRGDQASTLSRYGTRRVARSRQRIIARGRPTWEGMGTGTARHSILSKYGTKGVACSRWRSVARSEPTRYSTLSRYGKTAITFHVGIEGSCMVAMAVSTSLARLGCLLLSDASTMTGLGPRKCMDSGERRMQLELGAAA
jgi:hypothetical protein